MKNNFDKYLLQKKIEFRHLCKYELSILSITILILSICVYVCVCAHQFMTRVEDQRSSISRIWKLNLEGTRIEIFFSLPAKVFSQSSR